MQWSSDRNAGFSSADRQRLFLPVVTDAEYHYEAVNVAAQQSNPQSLLWWTKRIIALRKLHPAFGRGSLRVLHPGNRRILAFIRENADETLLVVANLSRYPQWTELDLNEPARAVATLLEYEAKARQVALTLELGDHLPAVRVDGILMEQVIYNLARNAIEGASLEQALAIAERIRSSIERAKYQNITVSIGLSEYRDPFDIEGFVKSADDAMYAAKHSGGNRIHTNTT